MQNPKSTGGLAGAVVLGLALGASGQRLISPPLDVEVKPLAMRWLDEGPGKSARYAIAVGVKVGSAAGAREVVCEADGSAPKLNGTAVDAAPFADLCKAAAAFSAEATKDFGLVVDQLSR